MDFPSLLLLLSLALLIWYWIDSLGDLEIAREAGRKTCLNADVQFLDDTVAGIALQLVRNEYGRRVFRRTYRFEFSETGNTRREGRVILCGHKVESVTMDPYQLFNPHEPLDYSCADCRREAPPASQAPSIDDLQDTGRSGKETLHS